MSLQPNVAAGCGSAWCTSPYPYRAYGHSLGGLGGSCPVTVALPLRGLLDYTLLFRPPLLREWRKKYDHQQDADYYFQVVLIHGCWVVDQDMTTWDRQAEDCVWKPVRATPDKTAAAEPDAEPLPGLLCSDCLTSSTSPLVRGVDEPFLRVSRYMMERMKERSLRRCLSEPRWWSPSGPSLPPSLRVLVAPLEGCLQQCLQVVFRTFSKQF